MNRWIFLRGARGPAFLILFGIMALLSEWGILSFHRSWPLFLILAGVLLLAERAALAGPPLPSPSSPGPRQAGSFSAAPPASPTVAVDGPENGKEGA